MPGPNAASLLDDIMRSALEVEYEQAAGKRPDSNERNGLPAGRQGWLRALPMLALLVLIGVLVVSSVAAQRGNAERLRAQRPALVDRIEDQTARVEALQRQVDALRQQVAAATRAELQLTTAGRQLAADVDALQQATAAVPAAGDGIRVVVDDAPAGDGAGGGGRVRNRIYDTDLQRLVNGLWSAGAEAVAINGQRIGPMTAIRAAGDAILVGYRPLTRPYTVEAIGDTRTLEADFVDGPGGLWLRGLRENYGIRFDVTTRSNLSLPASNQVGLTLASGHPASGTGDRRQPIEQERSTP
ncbi:MAG: DUF881 domain-containing protein [Sporichthyaceae bacterium]|nr:DUF881 domain-containing protein [Sporichthyaceae bacterium]